MWGSNSKTGITFNMLHCKNGSEVKREERINIHSRVDCRIYIPFLLSTHPRCLVTILLY